MSDIARIREFVQLGKYRVKWHAAQHAIEDGFDESKMVEAVLSGLMLEDYEDENRCLIVGRFHWTETTIDVMHVVVDTSQSDRVDFVTAYLPRPPQWLSPRQRGKKR